MRKLTSEPQFHLIKHSVLKLWKFRPFGTPVGYRLQCSLSSTQRADVIETTLMADATFTVRYPGIRAVGDPCVKLCEPDLSGVMVQRDIDCGLLIGAVHTHTISLISLSSVRRKDSPSPDPIRAKLLKLRSYRIGVASVDIV